MPSRDAPFPDHFSATSDRYARYRPRYPDALFDLLADRAPGRSLAWDCGTGNGQAAIALADRFDRVVATDASAEQLANATPHDRVAYRRARVEDPGIDDDTVDAVTAGQAAHWFDLDAFYPAVRRVLRPGGLLALWVYTRCHVDPAVDPVFDHYYDEVAGPWWPPERAVVEDAYRDLPFPFEEIDPPPIEMADDWTRDRVAGYVGTWSASKRLREAEGPGPFEEFIRELERAWPDGDVPRRVTWGFGLRLGRVE